MPLSDDRDKTSSPPRANGLILTGLGLIGASLLALAILGQAARQQTGAFNPDSTATPDAFAGVRSNAQAAFERGRRHFEQADYAMALLEFDRAKVNDPDNRADIQTMLDRTLDELRKLEPTAEATASPLQRIIATPTPYVVVLTYSRGETPAPPVSTPAAVRDTGVQTYTHQDQHFSLDYPSEWRVAEQPEAEAGIGIVAFQAPSGKASLVVSVDILRQALSPELYSAHLETSMQKLPGYSLEHASPAASGLGPGWQRVYSIAPAGREPSRTLQVVLGRRDTIFILTGTAPADDFDGSSPTFHRMVKSFRSTL